MNRDGAPRKQLGRDDIEYGHFGENFTVEGLPDDEVHIGDRYRIGEAESEVTQLRVTCYRVGMRLGEPEMGLAPRRPPPARLLLPSHHQPSSSSASTPAASTASPRPLKAQVGLAANGTAVRGRVAVALVLLVAAVIVVVVPAGVAAAGAGVCRAVTGVGSAQGVASGGVCAFKGIPYAKPPVGNLRFRPPQPAAPWTGTLRAEDDTRVCPQHASKDESYLPGQRSFTNEDCLYLNVWTPGVDRAKRPVIVYIHGGAGIHGTANETLFDGSILSARGDVVIVTINYRLGMLGFTELGGLDPDYAGSGNNGLRDQILALSWVQQHVRDFGGDPDNVTVLGQSTGAFSISALLATAHPQRLFRRAMLESGNGYLVHTRWFQENTSAKFLGTNGIASLAQLRAMNTSQILEAQDKALGGFKGPSAALSFGPYVDGTLVRGPVLEELAAGNAAGIDLLVGTNHDEMKFWAQWTPQLLQMTQAQYTTFPKQLATQREHMVSVYTADRPHPRNPGDVALAMIRDQIMRVPATRMAESQSPWARSYMYEFDWTADPTFGAVHRSELAFVFGTLDMLAIPGGNAALREHPTQLRTLSNQMLDAWVSFARSGDPNQRRTVSRPYWPAYRLPCRATMVFNTTTTIAHAPAENERALWDSYPFTGFPLGQ